MKKILFLITISVCAFSANMSAMEQDASNWQEIIYGKSEGPEALNYVKTMQSQKHFPSNLSALYSEFMGLLLSRQATPEKIREFIAKGALRNFRTIDGGLTPLHIALDQGYGIDVIKTLLEDGPDLKALGITPTDLLYAKTSNGSLPVNLGINEKSKIYLLSILSPQEIQHLVPGIIAMKQKLRKAGANTGDAKDLGRLTANMLVDDIVNQKMLLLERDLWDYAWPNYSKDELRTEVKKQILKSLKESAPKFSLNKDNANALEWLSNTAQ